jgi:peptidyl-prolyl cis-trans isomerase SurA
MSPRRTGLLFFAFVTGLALIAAPARAEPVVIDRVVAVVGPKPLLLSELRARAAPMIAKLHASSPAPGAKAERDLVNEVLQRMVDAELVAQAAERAQIEATSIEIDAALTRVAAVNRMGVREILAEAQKQGFTERLYREELGRQLREAKMLRLLPVPRGVKLAELDDRRQSEVLEQMRKTWLAELRRATYVELRL